MLVYLISLIWFRSTSSHFQDEWNTLWRMLLKPWSYGQSSCWWCCFYRRAEGPSFGTSGNYQELNQQAQWVNKQADFRPLLEFWKSVRALPCPAAWIFQPLWLRSKKVQKSWIFHDKKLTKLQGPENLNFPWQKIDETPRSRKSEFSMTKNWRNSKVQKIWIFHDKKLMKFQGVFWIRHWKEATEFEWRWSLAGHFSVR